VPLTRRVRWAGFAEIDVPALEDKQRRFGFLSEDEFKRARSANPSGAAAIVGTVARRIGF
jgi:hypothetical protein